MNDEELRKARESERIRGIEEKMEAYIVPVIIVILVIFTALGVGVSTCVRC